MAEWQIWLFIALISIILTLLIIPWVNADPNVTPALVLAFLYWWGFVCFGAARLLWH